MLSIYLYSAQFQNVLMWEIALWEGLELKNINKSMKMFFNVKF